MVVIGDFPGTIATVLLINVAISLLFYLITFLRKTEYTNTLRKHFPVILLITCLYDYTLIISYYQDLDNTTNNQSFNAFKIIIFTLSILFLLKGSVEQVLIDSNQFKGKLQNLRKFLRNHAYGNLLIVLAASLSAVAWSIDDNYPSTAGKVNVIYATGFYPISLLVFLLYYRIVEEWTLVWLVEIT